MDKKVDVYIEQQKSPQKEIIQKVRSIFLKKLMIGIGQFLRGLLPWAQHSTNLLALQLRMTQKYYLN